LMKCFASKSEGECARGVGQGQGEESITFGRYGRMAGHFQLDSGGLPADDTDNFTAQSARQLVGTSLLPWRGHRV
jgi:hypothetical protein